MNNLPQVSVIIPTYNRAHLVERAIDSVLTQTFQDLELLVVDDCSTDNTQEIVESFGDSRITYLRREENGGVSAARNSGIRVARGEYIAFLDSDDEWLPQKLEKQLNVFQETRWPNLGVVMCGYNVKDEEGVHQGRLFDIRGDGYEDILMRRAHGFLVQAMLVRRSAWYEPLFFDEEFLCGEDRDYLIRASQTSQIDFVSEHLVLIDRFNRERLTNSMDARIAGMHRILEKNFGYLKRNPRLLKTFHQMLALRYVEQRRWGDFRRHALRAVVAFPFHPGPYVWLLGSLFGQSGFRLALKLFH